MRKKHVEEKITSYESFIECKLKKDLKDLEVLLDKKNDNYKLWQELKNFIRHIQQFKDEELNTTFELGLGIFLGAKIENAETVIVNVGCDCYLEMYFDEASKYSDIRMKYLKKEIDFLRQQASHVKAHIKLALLAINELRTVGIMYTLNHKYFLQFMLQNSYVSVRKALEFCNKTAIAEVTNAATLKAFMVEINLEIADQKLNLVVVPCQVTGDYKLILLNTANDYVAKLQDTFTSNDLEYFQNVMHELVISDDHKLNKMSCYHLNVPVRGLTKDGMDKLLTTWVKGGYLVEKDSYIYFGPRCIMEFAPYFNSECKEYFSNCVLCSETVFVGCVCANCGKVMHRRCLNKYLAKKHKCPDCKMDWNELGSTMDADE
ncbi:hypothetical protein FQA39_LY15702 [Lamprigera yunnana]|nr:hypothetical protein FQA39_LY15702 [Lamprigera yunnana]